MGGEGRSGWGLGGGAGLVGALGLTLGLAFGVAALLTGGVYRRG